MCPKNHELSAYFDGELPEWRRKSLAMHIQSCRACRSALHIFELQRKILSLQSPAIDSNPNRYRKFWNYVGKAKVVQTRGPRPVAVPLPLIVAAFILIPILGALNLISRPIGKTRAFPHASTVITFSISPGELESLLSYLEGRGMANSEQNSMYTLPLPLTRFGDPLIVRSAVIEGEP